MLYKFPEKGPMKETWLSVIRAQRCEYDWMPTTHSTVCSDHFLPEDIYMTKKNVRRLKRTAVPVIMQDQLNIVSSLSSATNSERVNVSDERLIIEIPRETFSETELRKISLAKRNLQLKNYYLARKNKRLKEKCNNLKQIMSKPWKTPKGSYDCYTQNVADCSSNLVTVLCPKCNTNIEQTVEGIQADQTKTVIRNVYRYFEQEYEELKEIYKDLDLSSLSQFTKRTALATGVRETTVLKILQEELEQNVASKVELPQQRQATKRPRQTDSSQEEDSSDDNDNDDEPPGNVDEAQSDFEMETLEVKIEPPDEDFDKASADPLAVKPEPRDDEQDNSVKILVVGNSGGVTLTKQYEETPKDSTSTHSNKRLVVSDSGGIALTEENIQRPKDVTPTHSNKILVVSDSGDITLSEENNQKPKGATLTRTTRQHTQRGGPSTSGYTRRVPSNEGLDKSTVLEETEIKEEIEEPNEEGFS